MKAALTSKQYHSTAALHLRTFLLSFLHLNLIALIDAIWKGGAKLSYRTWEALPAFYKSPLALGELGQGKGWYVIIVIGVMWVLPAIFISRYHLISTLVWGALGAESFGYWFYGAAFGIERAHWAANAQLSVSSIGRAEFYPAVAPWMDTLLLMPNYPLKLLGGGFPVTREAVMWGSLLALVINLLLAVNLRAIRGMLRRARRGRTSPGPA